VTNKLKRNDLVQLEIDDLAVTGKSVGRINGMVVMSDQGLPGELIECRITEVKRNYAFAVQTKLIRAGSSRISPRCNHFVECGGCTWQNLAYGDQISFKTKFVSDALTRIGKLEGIKLDPAVKSRNEFYYRNKMEYSFSELDGNSVAGMHVRGRYDSIFNLEECYLQSEASVAALKFIRQRAAELEIPFYNFRSSEGELRFLVVREGKLTGDFMLNLVTFNKEFPRKEELFSSIVSGISGLTSFFHTVNGQKAHVAIGPEVVPIFGEEYLTEKIGKLMFRLTPFSFFQTNTHQTEVLYEIIKDHAAPTSTQSILDLFCGCGSIGLYLAAAVKEVLGIEINAEAIEMAKLNADLNGIGNARFVSGDVRKLLVELNDQGHKFDTIIADPPRSGLEQTAIRRIVRLEPKKIVAVSCNPATLARDLSLLVEAGYQVMRITPVDMFPQTAHIETVVTLDKNK
jgi:23S rRNA (uracil1939-C5)-methyltransferase